VNRYVPFGFVNATVPVVELNDEPPVMFTYHSVPEARPASVNVTEYVTWVKANVDSVTVEPLTVTDPV
jgi:hypothetical protein